MYGFFWEYHQQNQISQAESSANSARRDVVAHEQRLRDVELQLARVTLVSQALWELLRERTGVTDEELLDKIGEVDLRDGKLDNRLSPQTIACVKCERTLSTKHTRCIYCGTAVEKPHVYQ